MGFKLTVWQMPYIAEGSAFFDELQAADAFVKNPDGTLYDSAAYYGPGEFGGIVAVIDFTNPAAVRIYREALSRLFALGVKVIKTDFGEGAPATGVYHDGTPGSHMHNLYPLLYNRIVFELTRELTGELMDEGLVWSRSAWAGSQRYPVHWGGDSSTNYHSMQPSLDGGLSLGLSGFGFWSQDIGGFIGPPPEDRLTIRWLQMGLFHSHSRIHGWGNRKVYEFAPETMRICRDLIRLRYRLLPYIYGSAVSCVADSLPMLRALVIEYQSDPNTWNISNEYLFGRDLLVAPICDEGERRRVYLPEGTWTDWWTRERVAGPCWIEARCDIERIPLYVREGAIVPLGEVMNYVDERPTQKLELLISPFTATGTSRFDIPVNGETLTVTYTAARGTHTVTIPRTDVDVEVVSLGDAEMVISNQ